MKKVMTVVGALTLFLTANACSEVAEPPTQVSSIEGTWKTDPDSYQFANAEMRHFVLTDGQFSCESCDPSFSIPADGEFHPVDMPGFADEQSIEVIGERSIEGGRRIAGENVGNGIWTVSDDDQSLQIEWTDLGGDEPVTGTDVLNRIEAAPDGAHPISGVWTLSSRREISDDGQGVTYALDGEILTAKHNAGGYAATLGGASVTPEGDESGGMLAVEKINDSTYREIYTLDGEVINVLDITVDGDTLRYESTYQPNGEVTRWSATRQ